jgi:inward rectifier potassium channel
MSLLKKLNARATDTNQTGFGTNSEYSGGRFYNKNGSPNMGLKGIGLLESFSIYNTMLKVKSWKFFTIILCFYGLVNLLFAGLYMLVGAEHLGGMEGTSDLKRFWEAFFFSAQTLSTVGYGHIYPSGMLTNCLAAIESLIGLLSFALATGMMYGRFSQPKAYIKYSANTLFAPFKGGTAVMFRLVPYKHRNLSDAEVKATLAMKVMEDGQRVNRFFTLPLEISKINALTLSWTLVHVINETSPFYNLTREDLISSSAELLIFLKAYDETYSNFVVSRTSYEASEFIYGGKFKLMYHPSDDKEHTILDVNLLSQYDKVQLPDGIYA